MEPTAPIIATTATGGSIAFSREERQRHVYIVGKSGSGKSTVLFNLAMHDIYAGEGVVVIDPHGDLAESIIDALPSQRINEVCYLNVADVEFPVGFNPLAGVPPERHALAAAGMVSAFKHLWSDSWGPRLEHFLYNGVAALLASPRPTLIDLPRIYTDTEFRNRIVARLADPIALRFWCDEYPSYTDRFQAEAVAPILNKVGQIAASPVLRNILGQHRPKFHLAFSMNNRRIFIANLAKGRIGEQASNLLGSLILSHLQLIAMARSELAPAERVPLFCHVDELQDFTTDTFATLFSEARKFACHFCCANQFLEQVPPIIRAAVLGNAGTLIVFRVSSNDAVLLAPEFHPLPAAELADQSPYTAQLRRSDTGHRTIFLEPPLYPPRNQRKNVIAQSRRNFGRARSLIEKSFSEGGCH